MPLHDTLQLSTLHPAGRAFVVNTSSRNDAGSLVGILNGVSLSSLGLDSGGPEGKKRRIKCCLLTDVTDLRVRRKRCRLIIRNLAFQATEAMVRERLDLFGPLVEVDVPRVRVSVQTDEGETERLNPRGFGFVTFLCEKDANIAVSASVLDGDSSGGKGVKICNRFVAIDFCVAKDRYVQREETGSLAIAEEAGARSEEDLEPTEEAEDTEENNGEDEADEEDNSVEDENVEDSSQNDDMEENLSVAAEGKTALGSDVHEGCTVFVR